MKPKLIDLRLDLWGAQDAGDNRHAQTIMTSLGIKRVFDIPQSIADQWWFLGCSNVPDELPSFITKMDIKNPRELIGYGMNKEMADRLIAERAK